MNTVRLLGAALLAAASLSTTARAASFASHVLDYTPGTGATLTNPAAALGAPGPIVGAGSGFDSVFSPFNPHFEASQIVQVGLGGSLTLQLSNFVLIDRTPGVFELGVWENVGLFDNDFPNGTATNPAGEFGSDFARVEVSPDNSTWYALNGGNRILFNVPGNYFLNAGPIDPAPPASPQFADFGKPFTGGLAAFDGKTYPQILATLDGSAGGTWLNLDSLPLGVTQIGFVRFSDPLMGPGSTFPPVTDTIEINAVAINQSLAGPPTPEPATGALLLAALGFSATRRSRRS